MNNGGNHMNLYCNSNIFSIKLVEGNYIRYEDENDPFCRISISASDSAASFQFGGLGLHRSHLRDIISEIDKTLACEHNSDYHLRFADPHVVGGDCYSPISFYIHRGNTHEEDYWEFIYEANGGWHNSGKKKYSLCLCTDDLKKLKIELETQVNRFNWDEQGKIDYYKIDLPDQEYKTSYSAAELSDELSHLLRGKTLKMMCADLHGYIDSQQYGGNKISFSCSGGPALLLFDDVAVDLFIHGEGMIQYRVFEAFDDKCIAKKRGYAPLESYNMPAYYYDLAADLSLSYEGSTVNNIEISPTTVWPFYQGWFDEEKANASNGLPNIIKFQLSNNVQICFAGDCIEYYYMYLEQC